ncbi:Interferon-induced GTP-binding protein Mx-like protein, partial [Tolypocladium paradoxum]
QALQTFINHHDPHSTANARLKYRGITLDDYRLLLAYYINSSGIYFSYAYDENWLSNEFAAQNQWNTTLLSVQEDLNDAERIVQTASDTDSFKECLKRGVKGQLLLYERLTAQMKQLKWAVDLTPQVYGALRAHEYLRSTIPTSTPSFWQFSKQAMTCCPTQIPLSKGKELPGNYNAALLAELFHEQSRRWRGIAEVHVHDVLHIVSKWTRCAVRNLIHEEKLRGEVGTILEDWLENTEQLALQELANLIEDERRSPLTYNHYYTDNVPNSRLDNQRTAVENAIRPVTAQDWNGKLHISNNQYDVEKFMSAIGSKITVDMDEQTCNEAMTQLDAYYKVAMKTFVDNVARQVIERHIVSPLRKAFCPNSVSQLSEEVLLTIGSEPEQKTAQRQKLMTLAQGLKKSLKDLQMPL